MYTLATIAALTGSTLALSSYAASPSAPAAYSTATSQPPTYGSSSNTISTSYAPGSQPAGYGSSSTTISTSYAPGSQPAGYGSSSSTDSSSSPASSPASSWAPVSSSSPASSPASSWAPVSSSSTATSWTLVGSSSTPHVVSSSSSYVVYPTGSSVTWGHQNPSGYPTPHPPTTYPGQPGNPPSNHPSGPGSPPSTHPNGPGGWSPGPPSGPGGWTVPSSPGNGCPVDPSQYCLSYEDSEEAADVFRELIQNYSDELALEYLTEDFVDYSSSVAIIINGGDGEPLDIEKPTFVGRQAFMDAQGSQPEIPFKKLQRFHGCNSVSMRWLTRRSANGQPTETARIPVVGNVLIETVQSNPGDAHNFRIKTIFSEFNSAAWLVNLGVFVPENGTEGDAGTKRSLPADLRGPMI